MASFLWMNCYFELELQLSGSVRRFLTSNATFFDKMGASFELPVTKLLSRLESHHTRPGIDILKLVQFSRN